MPPLPTNAPVAVHGPQKNSEGRSQNVPLPNAPEFAARTPRHSKREIDQAKASEACGPQEEPDSYSCNSSLSELSNPPLLVAAL